MSPRLHGANANAFVAATGRSPRCLCAVHSRTFETLAQTAFGAWRCSSRLVSSWLGSVCQDLLSVETAFSITHM